MPQIDRINGLVGSIAVKVPCKAATTANITLSGAQTIDGVSLVSGDRCLVKNQTTASENGIYDVSATEWSRSLDFNGTRDIAQGTCVRIISGTVSGQYFYEVTTADPIIGNTDIDFALVNFPNATSAYIATLLDDTTAAAARATLEVNNIYVGTAGGTADALTSSLTPTMTALADGDIVFLSALLSNATTTPTFNPDSLGTKTITKEGNQALAIGDIARVGHEIILRYDEGNTVWELLNPLDHKFRGCLVYHDAAQTVTTSISADVAFNQETYDTDSIHDTATNNERLTVPSGVTRVRISGQISFDPNTTGVRTFSLYKNGGVNYGGQVTEIQNANAATWENFMSINSPVLSVTSGDYFNLKAYQNSGGDLDIKGGLNGRHTWFAMEIIE